MIKKLHNDSRFCDIRRYTFMRQNRTTVDINFVIYNHIISQNRATFDTSPTTDRGIPTDDTRIDPRKVLNLHTFQEHTSLKTHTVTDHHVGTDDYIGANTTVFTDLGRRMNHDITLVYIILVSQRLRLLFSQMGQIETCTGQKVLGLTDIHPEAFQIKCVKLTCLGNKRKYFFFDRCGF